jgi:FkbM family methyltransferase
MSQQALWEQVEAQKLRNFFRHFEVDCVFDVGANRGQYYDLLRGPVGYEGLVISFEPMPHAYKELETRASVDPKMHIRQVALDRFAGKANFNVMTNDKFSSLKSPSTSDYDKLATANSVQRTIEVTTSTLSLEVSGLSSELGFKRPFLKMDTQGNDVNVVEGAGLDILKFVGIQSELSIKKLYSETLYFHEVIAYYLAKGFAISSIFENNAGHFPDLVEMDCLMYRR